MQMQGVISLVRLTKVSNLEQAASQLLLMCTDNIAKPVIIIMNLSPVYHQWNCSIPPSSEAFTEDVHIFHLQVAIWKATLIEPPP